MKNKEKDIFSVVSNITLFILVVLSLLLIYAIYTKANFILANIVAIFMSLDTYISLRKQIKLR